MENKSLIIILVNDKTQFETKALVQSEHNARIFNFVLYYAKVKNLD